MASILVIAYNVVVTDSMGMHTYFTPADSPTEVDMKYIQLLGACTRAPEGIVARLILMGIYVSVNCYYM
jgi:hypothetical protein